MVRPYIFGPSPYTQNTNGNAVAISSIPLISPLNPVDGQVIKYNQANNEWEAGNDIVGTNAVQIQGVNVSGTTPTNGQSFVYNAGLARWEPATPSTNATALQSFPVSASPPPTFGLLQWNGSAWDPAPATSVQTDAVLLNGIQINPNPPADQDVLRYDSGLNSWELVPQQNLTANAWALNSILLDTNIPALNQVLRFNGTKWLLTNQGSLDTNGVSLQSIPINATPPTANQLLVYNGASYTPTSQTDLNTNASHIASLPISGTPSANTVLRSDGTQWVATNQDSLNVGVVKGLTINTGPVANSVLFANSILQGSFQPVSNAIFGCGSLLGINAGTAPTPTANHQFSVLRWDYGNTGQWENSVINTGGKLTRSLGGTSPNRTIDLNTYTMETIDANEMSQSGNMGKSIISNFLITLTPANNEYTLFQRRISGYTALGTLEFDIFWFPNAGAPNTVSWEIGFAVIQPTATRPIVSALTYTTGLISSTANNQVEKTTIAVPSGGFTDGDLIQFRFSRNGGAHGGGAINLVSLSLRYN